MRVMRVSGNEFRLVSGSPLSSAIIAGGISCAATQIVLRRQVIAHAQSIGHKAFNGEAQAQANCQKIDAFRLPTNVET